MGATQQVSCDVLVRGVRPTGINWKRLEQRHFERNSFPTKRNRTRFDSFMIDGFMK